MVNQAEGLIRETFEKLGDTLGIHIDIPDEMIANLAATLQADIDRLEAAVDTERFSFLNELGVAFRRGEKNARPSQLPVLEGIRAVLAHLHSNGRLIPAGGMALTAEQVEDVRTVANCALQYGNIASREAASRLDSSLPVTEPAEPAASEGVNCGANSVVLGWCTLSAQHEGLHTNGTYFWGQAPTPAEPAEEETKAEEETALLCSHPMCRHTNWGGRNRKHLRFSDCPIVPVPASSAVVPAPTETGPWHHRDGRICVYVQHLPLTLRYRIGRFNVHGDFVHDDSKRELPEGFAPFVAAPTGTGPWQRIEDVPKSVYLIKDCEGDKWRRDRKSWEVYSERGFRWHPGFPDRFAPFVAAEEG